MIFKKINEILNISTAAKKSMMALGSVIAIEISNIMNSRCVKSVLGRNENTALEQCVLHHYFSTVAGDIPWYNLGNWCNVLCWPKRFNIFDTCSGPCHEEVQNLQRLIIKTKKHRVMGEF